MSHDEIGTENSASVDPVRMVTVWCPDWPVVAAGCRSDEPAAVMRGHRVVARTPAAADEGIVIGQRRRQAQQRCPSITLLDADPARDAREFESIVRAVAEIAPRVDVVEPGWLAVAARGPSRYFGGDEAMATHLSDVVSGVRAGVGLGVGVGVGVADGRFASGVAARLGVRRQSPIVVDPGGSGEFCAPLPIGWLQTLDEVDTDLIDLFGRLGLRRLGALAALDPSDVLGRFGPVGIHAHRLASGADVRPASTTDPAPERRLVRVLDDPAAQSDAVVFVAKQLADELADRLAADGRVCTRLVVLLETEHGERSERSWYRSAGMSAAAMVERVRWQLDAWINLPRGSEHEITGGVTSVRLTPEEIRADEGDQLGLWGGQSDADRRAIRAIARLTTLTSETAVTVPVWNGGRLPADRYRWMPATLVDLDQRERAVSRSATGAGLD
ncbi:Y-family DNA polymerase, partial [Ilumatobacter sp.]|uniref:Y-family DNA polymerase n=1 Tax=Ilumatobacter sp. TaxID=1967498 RepID=UPI003C6B1C96